MKTYMQGTAPTRTLLHGTTCTTGPTMPCTGKPSPGRGSGTGSCIRQVPSHSSRGRSLSSTCRWHPSLIMRHSLEYILRSEAHTGLWGTLEQSSLHEQRGRPSLSTVHVDPYSHVIPEHTSPSAPCCPTGWSSPWGPTTTGGGEESWALTRLGSSSVSTSTPQGRVLVGYTH